MGPFPLRLLLGFVAAGLLATLAILVIPGGGGDTPPESTLVGVAVAVAAVTGVALYAGLRLDLGLPASIALYAVGYNLLVVLVKFVLGPRALYDASEAGKVTSDLGKDDITVITAIGIAAMYLLAFWILYRLARRRLERRRLTRPGAAWVVVGIVLVLVFLSGLLPTLLLLFAADGRRVRRLRPQRGSLTRRRRRAGGCGRRSPGLALTKHGGPRAGWWGTRRCWPRSSGSASPTSRSTTRSGSSMCSCSRPSGR